MTSAKGCNGAEYRSRRLSCKIGQDEKNKRGSGPQPLIFPGLKPNFNLLIFKGFNFS